MAKVITTASRITCSHQGTVTITAGQQLLKVDGNAVLVQGDDATGVVGPDCTNKGPNLTQCTKITLVAGTATKLKVGGKAVLLETATGTTNSVPPGTWQVQSAGQTKLDAS